MKKFFMMALAAICAILAFNSCETLDPDKDLDYLTRIIGYLKRVSNFSEPRQREASRRYYANLNKDKEAC